MEDAALEDHGVPDGVDEVPLEELVEGGGGRHLVGVPDLYLPSMRVVDLLLDFWRNVRAVGLEVEGQALSASLVLEMH